MADQAVSEQSKQRAQAAKAYIENQYKAAHKNRQERLDRCALQAVQQ